MPVDSRIVWEETESSKGIFIKGSLICTFCNHTFSRETTLPPKAVKEAVWDAKEIISNEIGQHNHGI